jgi:hypothetical protein
LIDAVLDANKIAQERSEWVKAQSFQSNMVRGYERLALHAINDARRIFEDNLAQPIPKDIKETTRAGYLKMRFKNLNGILKCDLEDPEYHFKSVLKSLETIEKAIAEWNTATTKLTTAQGWAEHNKYLQDSAGAWRALLWISELDDSMKGEGGLEDRVKFRNQSQFPALLIEA